MLCFIIIFVEIFICFNKCIQLDPLLIFEFSKNNKTHRELS